MGEGVTIYDVQRFGSDRSHRELPRVVVRALKLTAAAGRRELVTVLVLEALAAVGLAALVLLGRDVLTGVLAADRADTGWDDLVPDLVALAVLSTVLTVGQAFVLRWHQLPSELEPRRGGRIVEAGSHAELMARGGAYAELFGLQAAAYAG